MWRSPLRGPWLTSVFGFVLLVGVPILIVTGLLSYAAYDPGFGGSNQQTPGSGVLGKLVPFDWPSGVAWLYRLTQGVHVVLGLALVPILLWKLWSVVPKLFDWPPVVSVAQALERLTIGLLVGGALLTFLTGVINIQVYYPWRFSFYSAHFYASWVFVGAFVAHVALKIPTMRRSLRARRLRDELALDTAHTQPEPPDPDALVSPNPAPATLSRRGALAIAGGSSLAVAGLTVGASLDGPWRSTALLSPRGRDYGSGPNDFQVNKTFASIGAPAEAIGPSWSLSLVGSGSELSLTRADLLAMEQITEELPIACVEGWSTVQTWTGVRLRDLAAMVGGSGADFLAVNSIQNGGFGSHTLNGGQLRNPRSLLALQVNGTDLSPDHGFPARIIVPNAPGVRNTKWVRRLGFGVAVEA